MAKGERVHDPLAVRGKMSKREGKKERRGKGGVEEEEEEKKVAKGKSHLLVNKEGKGKRKRGKKKEGREREGGREKGKGAGLLPSGINTERWSRVQ